MRKAAAVVVAVLLGLVVVAGAASYWLGIQAKHRYGILLRQIGKDGDFTISNLRYQAGWLGSTATATISVPGSAAEISVVSRIQPGPFPEIAKLQFMPAMAVVTTRIALNSRALTNFQPVKAHTMIYLAGNSVTRLEIPAYRRAVPGGTAFSWIPAKGNITASADHTATTGEITFPAVQMSSSKSSLTLTHVVFGWTRRPGGSDAGESSLAIGHISTPGPANPFHIQGLRITFWKQHSAGNVAAHIAMQVGTVNDGVSNYGPGQLQVQISKLDGASLDKFQRDMQALAHRRLSSGQRAAEMLTQTTGLLRTLAPKAPELEITKLGFKVGSIEIAGKGRFVLDNTDINASDYSTLLMQAMSGTGELLVPRSVVADLATDEIHRQLDTYKSQGTLTPEEIGKLTPRRVARIIRSALPEYMKQIASRWHLASAGADYMLSVAIHQGQLLINGQPASPGQSKH